MIYPFLNLIMSANYEKVSADGFSSVESFFDCIHCINSLFLMEIYSISNKYIKQYESYEFIDYVNRNCHA